MTDLSDLPWNPEAPWLRGRCRVPMWSGGMADGFCGAEAFGPQYPKQYLAAIDCRPVNYWPYVYGHCCANHGGPKEGQPIIFSDGTDERGRQMWCAVNPDFIDLQSSPAGFDVDPIIAVRKLKTAAEAEEAINDLS